MEDKNKVILLFFKKVNYNFNFQLLKFKRLDKLELLEKIKEKDFKSIKKYLKSIGITSKYIKTTIEPYAENEYSNEYIEFIKGNLNYYAAIRYINLFNKKQSELFIQHIEGNLIYDEKNWNKNIYKYDILIPQKIYSFIENYIFNAKNCNIEQYNFLINNRNGIYCIIYKIYKYWFSKKHSNDIELSKLYDARYSDNKLFVRISREELKKYSDNYIKILNFLEENEIIITDNYSRATVYNKQNNKLIPGICKGFRINDKLIDIHTEKNNKSIIVRINNKKAVTSLYYDYISYKEYTFNKASIENFSDLTENENNYYLRNYNIKQKRIKISDDCFNLLKRIESNLIVNCIEDVYEYVEKNQLLLIEQGKKREKENLIDKIYSYLNYFELRYNKSQNVRFKNFNSFLDRAGRFYTFFNFCPKELINILFKLKNKQGNIENLVEIDMRSCHLNMLALLFNKNVLKNFSIQSFVGPELLNWFDSKLDLIPKDQLSAFKNLCSSPDYYEKMTNLINAKSKKKYEINDIKRLNMYFLYGNNTSNPINHIFKLYFPFIIDFLEEVKKNYQSLSKLSYLLMRLESYFFIDKGIKKILESNITVLPKHDCYYVAESDVSKVKNILTNIYLELTEGDVDYIPSYDRETSRIRSLFDKFAVDSKLIKRDTQLKKYLDKTREEKIKINLYTNLYYKDFNDFLLESGIKNLKVDKKLSNEKFKKILTRLVKLKATDEYICKLEYMFEVFQTKDYEKYINNSTNYEKIFLKLIIIEYQALEIDYKIINEPVFISRQKISNTKIITPYEFYLLKTKEFHLKDRYTKQNYLIY